MCSTTSSAIRVGARWATRWHWLALLAATYGPQRPPVSTPRPYPSKTSQAEAHPDLLLVPQVFRHLQPSPLALAPPQQDIMWLAGSVRFHEDRGLNDVGGIIFGASQSSQGFPDPQSSPPPSSSPSITPSFRPGRNSKPGEVSAKPKWLDQFNKTRS